MKSKLFLCIKPVVAEPVEEGEGQRYVVVSKKISSERSSSCGGSGRCDGDHRRGRAVGGGGGGGKHKTFSQAIKAVLFEVSLKKSVPERQLRQLMPRSISKPTTNSIRSIKSQPEIQQQPQSIISRTSSLSSLNSLNHPKKSTNISSTDRVNNNSSLNYGMYMVVISLFVTIFCGKILGIFLMTMWMFYVRPSRSCYEGDQRSGTGGSTMKLPETEEEMVEYKKRVIMGGLLERNHRREIERALTF